MAEHQQVQKSTESKSNIQTRTIHPKQIPISNPMAIIQRARINPKSLTHADVMQLQRTIGNRAVGRLLSEIGLFSSKVNQTPPVQMQEIPEPEEEEPLQGKFAESIQRQELPEEEEPLQGKFENKPEQETCPSCSTLPIQRAKENHTGIPDNLKAGVESLSGIDMSDVRVHYNSDKPAEVRTLAYTQGTDIYVASGQERYLPHESWHVIQQKQERVRPTLHLKDVAVNDDTGLEKEADEMGEYANHSVVNSLVQRIPKYILPKQISVIQKGKEEQEDDVEPKKKRKRQESTPMQVDKPQTTTLQSGTESSRVEEKLVTPMQMDEPQTTTLQSGTETHRHNDSKELEKVKSYVESQKKLWGELSSKPKEYKDILLGSASRLLLSPSSGAYYHRSAKHPLYQEIRAHDKAKELTDMVVKKTRKPIGKGGEAHVGLYPNAFTFQKNMHLKQSKPKTPESDPQALPIKPTESILQTPDKSTSDLYDQSLAYKLSLCEKVVELSGKLTYLTIGVYHDYPLVMVHFDLENFMTDYTKNNPKKDLKKPSEGTKKAFTQFLLNHYTGIANYYAKSAGINLTMVERSSFGFNTPSIAETGESFRLNLGLMPPAYASVHADALKMLNDQLDNVMKKKVVRNKENSQLDTSDTYFKEGKKGEIDAINDWLVFALYGIESQGKSSITNAMRKRKSLDFVNAQSFKLMTEESRAEGLGTVLKKLFYYMKVKEETKGTKHTLVTEVNEGETKYDQMDIPTSKVYSQEKEMEKKYDSVLKLVRERMEKIAESEQDLELKNSLSKLINLVNSKNQNIEITLDLVNELLIIYALKQLEDEKENLRI